MGEIDLPVLAWLMSPQLVNSQLRFKGSLRGNSGTEFGQ